MDIADKFNPKTFASQFDHTMLKADATPQMISALCAEAIQLECAAVCVNPVNLPVAVRDLDGTSVLPITVIGFPLGAVPASWKVEETRRAIDMGAREIDMVMNVGLFLSGPDGRRGVAEEFSAVVSAAGDIPVKVIIETALMTPDSTQLAAMICADSGAAFVKTSTGFSSRGASLEDLAAIVAGIKASQNSKTQATRIKASGGIRTLEQALSMIAAGAHRVGSSNTVAILRDFTDLFAAAEARRVKK